MNLLCNLNKNAGALGNPAILFFLSLFVGTQQLHAQETNEIQNVWRQTFIEADGSKTSLAAKNTNTTWVIEPIDNSTDVRIKHQASGAYLNSETDDKFPMVGTIKPGWLSAMWTLEPVDGTEFVRIKNKWRGTYLHTETGALETGAIKSGWLSAQWKVTGKSGVGQSGNTNTNTNNAAALNDYVKSLNYDPRRLLAVQADGGTVLRDEPKGSEKKNRKEGNNKVTICTTTDYSMSKNFDEVVIMQPTNGIIYPGALIYADQNLVNGQPRPLTNLPAGSVRLTVDLPGLGERGSFAVKTPNNGTVQAGIDNTLRAWNEGPAYKEDYINASRSSSNIAVSYSSEQLGLGLGVDVKWSSGAVSSQFSFKSTSEKKVAVMMFKQVFYTVTAEPPAMPANAFQPSVTLAQAQAAFNASAPPAYVQSVSYGRIIMFRIETSANVTEADLKASLKYAAGDVSLGVNANANYKNILNNSSVTYALLGGNAEITSAIASARDFASLEPLIKGKNAVYSKSNPGVPVSYTVRFLKDHQIAKMGTTTNYTKEECKDYNNMSVKLAHSGAYVAKYLVSYTSNGAPIVIPHEGKTAGWTQVLNFPGDATNIRIQAWAATGLVWDPWGVIYDKYITPEELTGKCIRNHGTTLDRKWDYQCSF